jgi:glycolate oxidase
MISSLLQLLGAKNVLTEPEDIIPYGFDGTATLKQRPPAVAFPRSAGVVSDILKLAAEHNVPIVTRGSGTGLSGGSVPVSGSLVLCLVKMDKILEVDTANLTLHSGVTRPQNHSVC